MSIVGFYLLHKFEVDRKHMRTLFDVIELSVYFLETMPSVIVFVVRWKTLQQYQNILHKSLRDRFGDRVQLLESDSATDPDNYKFSHFTRTVKDTTEASEYLDRVNPSHVGSA